jgi:hypothetical protein
VQLKAGEVHASAAVATELLKQAGPELQVLGYTLLQHLVSGTPAAILQRKMHACLSCVLRGCCHMPVALQLRLQLLISVLRVVLPLLAAAQVGNRWEEFSQEEHTQLATLAYNMLKQGKAAPLPAAVSPRDAWLHPGRCCCYLAPSAPAAARADVICCC